MLKLRIKTKIVPNCTQKEYINENPKSAGPLLVSGLLEEVGDQCKHAIFLPPQLFIKLMKTPNLSNTGCDGCIDWFCGVCMD